MIIGISGKKYAGKSTAAQALRHYLQQQGYHATVLSLGWPIKEIKQGEGVDIQSTEHDPVLKEQIRAEYQDIGTDSGRAFNVNLWVDIMMYKIRAYYIWRGVKQSVVLLDDVRFPNEISKFYEEFDPATILTIRLLRDTARTEDALARHESETALDSAMLDFDYVLDNAAMSCDQKNRVIPVIFEHWQGRTSMATLEHAVYTNQGVLPHVQHKAA